MAWQPQLWAGSTRGTNLCVWPRHWFLASPVWAYRSCVLLEICLDMVKAALLDSRLETGAARVQASMAHQTWKGLTSRLALWQSPGKGLTGSGFLAAVSKNHRAGGVGLSLESLTVSYCKNSSGSFGVLRLKINRSAFLGSVATRIVLWGSPGLGLPTGGPIVVGCEKDGGWGG